MSSCTLSLTFGSRWVWVVNAMPRLLYRWEKVQLPLVQKAGCGLGLVWTNVENLSLADI
jgi:hypothetical protein